MKVWKVEKKKKKIVKKVLKKKKVIKKVPKKKKAIKKIVKKISGLSPYPGAWSTIKDSNKIIKIYDSLFHELSHDFEIGKIFIKSSNKLMVAVDNGALEILSLKIEGKKRISGPDYINGLKNKTPKLI